jgi:hypothetical protein
MFQQNVAMHRFGKFPFIIVCTFISAVLSCGNAESGDAEKSATRGNDLCPEIDKAWHNVLGSYQGRDEVFVKFVNEVKQSNAINDSLLIALADSRVEAMNVYTAGGAPTAEKIEALRVVQQMVRRRFTAVLLITLEDPELKKLPATAEIQSQLEGVENRIRYATDGYAAAVAGCKTIDQTQKDSLRLKWVKPTLKK